MLLESSLLREDSDHYELTGALDTITIPSTLQASLRARLDRLLGAGEIAQLGRYWDAPCAFLAAPP